MQSPQVNLESALTTALARAMADALQPGALTEPLAVYQIGEYFGLGRHAMARRLKTIPGVQRNGRNGLVRIPVSTMPPDYLASVALRSLSRLERFGALAQFTRNDRPALA